MITNVTEIKKEELLTIAQKMQYEGYRFVTATCVDNGDGSLDVLYHFDRELQLTNFRVRLSKDEEINSISRIFFSSVLVENEMKELFGLKVTNIVVDYGGHMLLTDDAPDNPMARQQIVIEQRGGGKNG